jgi:hypothetical protein
MGEAMNYSEILTEVTVDADNFQVTWNPYEENSCILWYRDIRKRLSYAALGKFSNFDKRKILDFVVRYATSAELRNEIENQKFECKLSQISLDYFEHIELARYANRERAYRSLFSLDSTIAHENLKVRRRMMARKFHPDAGGDNRAMTIINEAYDYLLKLSVDQPSGGTPR